MPFNQFTKCVDAKDFSGQGGYLQAGIAALMGGFITAAITFAVSGGPSWCLLFVPLIGGAIFEIAYCRWFLYDRLICLPDPSDPSRPGGSDQIAIGVVVKIDPPNTSFLNTINPDPGSFDNDYGISILLVPNEPGCTEDDKHLVENSMPFGFLVKEQDATRNEGLPFGGMTKTSEETGECSWVLHCEIEGAGNQDLMAAAEITLFLAVAALIACLMGGQVGLVIAVILAILSVLTFFLIDVPVAHSDSASPADVNPSLPSISAGDCLMIMGSWIYDAGHIHDSGVNGWNEIHPVKFFCKANCDSGDVILLKARWRGVIDGATSPATLESQKQPQNQWQVHPIIDGCQAPIVV
jgi:hypothetical protein